MSYLRVLVQECKPGTIEGLCREAERSLLPRIRGIPGFISYRIAQIDDHTMAAIGRFESRAAAEELNRIGAEWRKQYGKDAILSVRSQIGEIILEESGAGMEAQPTV